MKMNNRLGLTNQLRGIFSIERIRGGEITEMHKENMVVDSGLAAILQPSVNGIPVGVVEYARILKVSNDRTEVTATTTDIGTVVAAKTTSSLSKDTREAFVAKQGMSEDADGKYLFSRNEWIFEPGDIPSAISKIGVYSITYDEAGLPVEQGLYAATILTDSEGVVTGITPFDDESFAITYESRWYLPLNDVVIPSVDLKAAGIVDITIRAVGIPPAHPLASKLLQATSAQFSHNVLDDYDPTHPPALVFSSSQIHPAGTPYEDVELFLDTDRSNYAVTETVDPVANTITISIHLGRNQIWPAAARSAILYTSRGIYFLGFSNGIVKAAGSRRTITFNLTFKVGRKV